MKGIKFLVLCGILSPIIIFLSGCWDYTEIEKRAIVSGFAIDKEDNKYIVTIEVVDIKGGRDTKIGTKHITTEGRSIFEAVRRAIKVSGKKLYFPHAEIVVINKKLAEEGIVPVIDWIGRDSEPRDTLHILISKESSAKEILVKKPITTDILAYELNDILSSQKNLSYAMDIELWQFMIDLSENGIAATLPTVDLTLDSNMLVPEISGTGIFRKDKLVGFLDGEQTKTMMFIKNKIKGGLLTHNEDKDNSATNISLEILGNKTEVKPKYEGGKIIMEIDTTTDVAIGENGGKENFIDEPGRIKLKNDFEVMLENNIKELVEITQQQYDCDIFGFGKKVKIYKPDVWRKIEQSWEQEYKKVGVKVNSTINIKNSALESKPIKVGD